MEGLYVAATGIAEMTTGLGVSAGVGVGGMIGMGMLPLSKIRVQNWISSSSIMSSPLLLPFGSLADFGFLFTTIFLVRNLPTPPSTCRPSFAETGATPDERNPHATTMIRLNWCPIVLSVVCGWDNLLYFLSTQQ